MLETTRGTTCNTDCDEDSILWHVRTLHAVHAKRAQFHDAGIRSQCSPQESFCQCGSAVMVTKKSGFSWSLQHITVYAAVAANSVVYTADALVLSG